MGWGHLSKFLGIAVLACTVLTAQAQGVTKTEILIGRTTDLSGVQAPSSKDAATAALAYFDKINKAGGIHGRKIRMISLDDKYDIKQTAVNGQKLAKEEGVLALILGRGTPNGEALIPVAMENRIPVLGHAGGSVALHTPPTRYFFNLRPPYRIEVASAVKQLAAMGISRIASVYSEDSFGKDALIGFQEEMRNAKLEQLVTVGIPRGDTSIGEGPKRVEAAITKLAEANPQAIIGICIYKPCAAIIKGLRAKGYRGQFVTLSFTASSSYLKELGDLSLARGLIITQVFPSPTSLRTKLGVEYQALAAEYKLSSTYIAMEGYLTARVLVEAIKRCGQTPSREGLVEALESMNSLDLGGYVVTYGPQDRTASTLVELTMIGREGDFVR